MYLGFYIIQYIHNELPAMLIIIIIIIILLTNCTREECEFNGKMNRVRYFKLSQTFFYLNSLIENSKTK